MSIIKEILRSIPRPTTKHIVVGAVFMLALAGSIALGQSMRGSGQALTTFRDCRDNAIDHVAYPSAGMCGAYSAEEYIQDLNHNVPSDLQTLAEHFTNDFHLSPSEYADFQTRAMDGIAYKNGDIKLMDGTLIATDGWSIGRSFKSYSWKHTVNGVDYWASKSQDVFSIDMIPVIVYFDKTGTVQFITQKPCGNLMGATKIETSATCKSLVPEQDQTNPNKYNFTTDVFMKGNATLSKLEYHFSDTDETVVKTSATDKVAHTFLKDGTLIVTVTFNVPGGTIVVKCEKKITHIAPSAVCTALVPLGLDDKNQKWRMTAKTFTKYATLKGVTMSVDGKTAVPATLKDKDENYYMDFEFTDTAKHTIKAVASFDTIEGPATADCSQSVQSKKTPVCEVPGHEGKPIDANCGYCKPGIPIGDAKCKEVPPQVLSNTGPGNMLGLFAGTSAIGAIGHRLFSKRRANKTGL